MLVPSMTNEEIIREIELDYDVVKRKCDYLGNRLRKISIKSRKTIIKSIKYTSPRKNNWLLVFEVNKKVTYSSRYVYTKHDGFSAYGCLDEIKDGIVLITKHFLDRYNERFLKRPNISIIDILSTFLERNTDMDIIMQMGDEYRIFSTIVDGVALGNGYICKGYNIRIIKTFITNNMLFDSQESKYNNIKKQFIDNDKTTPFRDINDIINELLEKQEKAT